MKIINLTLLCYLILCIKSIGGEEKQMDNSTLSNYLEIQQNHLDGEIYIDFTTKILYGKLTYKFVALKQGNKIILDCNKLKINKITDLAGASLPFEIVDVPGKDYLGKALEISKQFNINDIIYIYIEYETTDESGAAQFLTPEQTEGKKHPFLFTQSEMILGRELLPIQDTPAVKLTVRMALRVMNPLKALYAGKLYDKKDNGDGTTTYYYEQLIPIPSYLISFAAGEIITEQLTENIYIHSEPSMMKKTLLEYAELPEFMKNCSEYLGEYVWGDYSMIILPKAFPVSGMENPTLNFIAPSLVAGDKSIVDIGIHELIHSWTGNLVTNDNWADYWLNEGITMFLQRKMVGKWKGEDYAKLDGILGLNYIDRCIEDFGENSSYTSLRPNLTGISPDDIYSDIPYEKGHNFMYYLETLIKKNSEGVDLFKEFFTQYLIDFKFKTINLEQFKEYFMGFMKNNSISQEVLDQIEWDKWIYSPGRPVHQNDFSNPLQDEADQLVEKFMNSQLDKDFIDKFMDWKTLVKVYFFLALGNQNITFTQEQHEFLAYNLSLVTQDQNLLTFVNYYRAILSRTYEFVKGEEEEFLKLIKDYAQRDYTVGLFELYYKRNKTGALELDKSLKILYHKLSYDFAKEEFDKAESEFDYIYLTEFINTECLENVDKNTKLYFKITGYKEDFGELTIDKKVYLVKQSDYNDRINLTCHISQTETYCQISGAEELTNKEEYYLLIESIQTEQYSIPYQTSSNSIILEICPPNNNDEDDGISGGAIAAIVISIILVASIVVYLLFFRRKHGRQNIDYNLSKNTDNKDITLLIDK